MLRRSIFGVALFLLLASAFAQEYPAKPITVIVAYPAGGNNDLRARRTAPALRAISGTRHSPRQRPMATRWASVPWGRSRSMARFIRT